METGELLEGRVWFQADDTILTLGLTSMAVDELGPIQNIELPAEGTALSEGDVLASLEGTKDSLEVALPVSGVVVGVNDDACENTDIITEDPLDSGWLVRIETEKPFKA